MRRTAPIPLFALATALFLLPQGADAQVAVEVRVRVPRITFEVAPPLVVVSPGIQVVPDYGHEVFFVDGWYWIRDDGHWFRSRSHRGGWVVIERGHVPPGLRKIPPGHYKHYKHSGRGHGGDRKAVRHDRGRDDRKHEHKHDRKRGRGNDKHKHKHEGKGKGNGRH